MNDDLFSQIFEMFNQPGPVNLRLATEVARHLTGERQPIDPWAAEEFRELTRLAEYRIEAVAPFAVAPAADVLPLDGREWADRNIEGFGYLVEPFGQMVDLSGAGPAAEMLKPLGPALAGMQLGTLVGSLAAWAMAGYDTGLPLRGDDTISYIVPTIDRFSSEHGFDARSVRLWVALEEVTHRAIFRVPFAVEAVVSRLGALAETMRISPDRLTDLMGGLDMTSMQTEGLDPERLAALFDSPETQAAAEELSALLGVVAGYRRLIVERAAAELLPDLGRMTGARDLERDLGDSLQGSPIAAAFVSAEDIERGRSFCLEIERRYGPDRLSSIFTLEGRFPTAAEVLDPVSWAARVLLEDMD
ncbi:MAG TPA: zinc-dependent metalloprotease [Acidimicrobiia bacterium]|nr:zinc-dependent metalloprotease [Acidimicrobiia bacterium]